MKFKHFFALLLVFFLINCNSDSNSNENPYRGLWIIQSITPEIISNPNQPDCRLLNDQISFNDFNNMSWSYPLPDSNGSYNQPCQNGFGQEVYNYQINDNTVSIYDQTSNVLINWSFELNGNLLKVT